MRTVAAVRLGLEFADCPMFPFDAQPQGKLNDVLGECGLRARVVSQIILVGGVIGP